MKKQIKYVGIGPRSAGSEIIETAKTVGAALGELGWLLRSGAAEGMDEAFEWGCDSVQGSKEIFVPEFNYRGRNNKTDKVVHTLDLHIEAMRKTSELFPKWKDYGTTVQMFLVRNTFALFGEKLNDPADAVIVWNQYEGTGTHQLLTMAKEVGIPAFNLRLEGSRDALDDFVFSHLEN